MPNNTKKRKGDNMKNFVHTMRNSNGEKWQEVSSKTYKLQEIAEYLAECLKEPQNDTTVFFSIRENGDLYIYTGNETISGQICASDFSVIED